MAVFIVFTKKKQESAITVEGIILAIRSDLGITVDDFS